VLTLSNVTLLDKLALIWSRHFGLFIKPDGSFTHWTISEASWMEFSPLHSYFFHIRFNNIFRYMVPYDESVIMSDILTSAMN
jgi:hypothetical protein